MWGRRARWPIVGLAWASLWAASGVRAQPSETAPEAPRVARPAWGEITPVSVQGLPVGELGLYRCVVRDWPADGRLPLPTPFPQIVRARLETPGASRGVAWEFNREATELTLLAPPASEVPPGATLLLETAERTRPFGDGRVVFAAREAEIVGATAKLEEHPGNYRVGFWTNAGDSARWTHAATRWGKYRVFVSYSAASPAGSEVEISLGEAAVKLTVEPTGGWWTYTTREAGTLYLPTAGKHTLAVKCLKKNGPAVMNLKAVLLAPACEGTPPRQADDGVVALHSRDAEVRGVTLRYEPDPKKNTLGYWVRASDAAAWRFTVAEPGEFDVEVLQGCGAGQGGSEVVLECGGQELVFRVEDTGHFQNFKPRVVGVLKIAAAGEHELTARPRAIAKQAALDLRQVRLIPRGE